MNRRGFIAAAVAAAVAPKELLRPVAAPAAPDYAAIGAAYTRALARSMVMTKEMISAQVYQAMIYGRAFSLVDRDGTIKLIEEEALSGNYDDEEALAGEIGCGTREAATWKDSKGETETSELESWGVGSLYGVERAG